jgi:S-adenosylmethionine:tRNA ribosyltransferase-isomerase
MNTKMFFQDEWATQATALDQWEAYDPRLPDFPAEEALKALLGQLEKNNQKKLVARTRLLIVPGYRFRIINGLITNFHQPRSTLLLLVAAFVGDDWRKIYQYALDHQFRFLSYGDGNLLWREVEGKV